MAALRMVFVYSNAFTFSNEAMTDFMIAVENPSSCSTLNPSMVVPPGDVTMSFNSPGCRVRHKEWHRPYCHIR